MDITNKLKLFMQLPDNKALFNNVEVKKGFAAFLDMDIAYSPRHLSPIMPMNQQSAFQSVAEQTPFKEDGVVYIHIPFCKQRCSYCGFYGVASDINKQEKYIESLCKELDMVKNLPYYQKKTISAVFIGGGTPSVLSAKQLEKLLAKITECIKLADDCEFTLESNIADFDNAKRDICLRYGVNRLSFGVQSFNSELRKLLGRTSDKEAVVNKLMQLSHNDVRVIIDLIYGLPGQTAKLWQEDLELVLQCGVDGVDLYKLQHFSKSIMSKKLEQGLYPSCLNKFDVAGLYKQGTDFLQLANWEALSCCHFTQSGKDISRYNRMAKNGSDIFAFGAGAGGSIGQLEYMQVSDLNKYIEKINNNKKPFAMLFKRDQWYALVADLVGQLDCGYLDIKKLETEHRIMLKKGLLPYIELWQQQGLCLYDNNFMQLVIAGKYWVRPITRILLGAIQYALYGDVNTTNKRMSMMSGMMNLK